MKKTFIKKLRFLPLMLTITVFISMFSFFTAYADEPTNNYTAKIGNTYYTSLKTAVESAKNGDVIEPANERVVITSGEKAELKSSVTVNGFTFGDGGFISAAGNYDFSLKNCKFTAQNPYINNGVRTPVSLSVKGKLTVTGNDFSKAADNAYFNCIETGYNGIYEVQNGSVFSENTFGNIANNAISIYSVSDNAVISIVKNNFKNSANPIRLGNTRYEYVNAIFDFKYNTSDTGSDFIILKDDGTTNENHEIFSGYKINIANLKNNKTGIMASSNNPRQYFVKNNGAVNQTSNMPAVTFNILPEPASASPSAVETPGLQPTIIPTLPPAVTTTAPPTSEPTAAPTLDPTAEPTMEPTPDPTKTPTAEPTIEPTEEPTFVPSAEPTAAASSDPEATNSPSTEPGSDPTATPSFDPEASISPIPTPEATANVPTQTPEPLYLVSINADENITNVKLINKETASETEMVRATDTADKVLFTASVPNGAYDISAIAIEGKEPDLKNSDISLNVNGYDISGTVVTQDAGTIDHIEISTPPTKTEYINGEKFDPAGLVLNIINTDGTSSNVVYDETTKDSFTFKPELDTEIPDIDVYSGDRFINIIYGNRLAKQELTFIMRYASAEIKAPASNQRVSFDVKIPGNSYYTSDQAEWDPTVYPGSNFNYGTVYTAAVTLHANDGYTFSKDEGAMTAYINNKPADIVNISEDGKSMTISHQFYKTSVMGGGNSGHSTGTTPTATPKPNLNTYDHFAYIVGYPDGYIRPESNITRDEVATIFFRLLTDKSRSQYWSQVNYYVDVPADLWSNNAISTLTKAGILGGDGTAYFKPTAYITRAEFATIAARFSDVVYSGTGKFGDVGGHWSENYVNIAAEEGWIQGYEDGTFKPDQLITRAEAMTLVNNVLNRHVRTSGLHKNMKTWADNKDKNEWYYTAVQEATNTHDYERPAGSTYETWTYIGRNPDWVQLEQKWSDANSAGSIN